MSFFPDDHPVEILRGYPKPSLSNAKRSLVDRCKWLSRKIEADVQNGRCSLNQHYLLNELAAVVAVIERAEEIQRSNVTACPVCEGPHDNAHHAAALKRNRQSQP